MQRPMSLSARKELVAGLVSRYTIAKRAEKQRILDEFTAVTNYHRKYAVFLLNKVEEESPPQPLSASRNRSRVYTDEVKDALISVWKASNQLCSKRLVPFLPEFIKSLERHRHLSLTEETHNLLLKISPATVDRLLYEVRHCGKGRGLATTRRGTLLKHQIPIRTFADWNDLKVGFMEADLVAHCGTSTQGAYINTLVLTDISTGWTECFALLFRGQDHVLASLEQARRLLPFPLLGLDTDNGSEFLNNELMRYCRAEQITFTRCRPYKKNDQCRVEQKNGSIVRKLVGYDRYEGMAACKQLASLYGVLRLYVNFFQPSLKLISKHRCGGKVTKKYDKAQTPYQRVLTCSDISDEVKEFLRAEYIRLDPVELLKQMEHLQDLFWQYAHRPANSMNERHPLISTTIAMNNSPDALIQQSAPKNRVSDNYPRMYRSTPKPRRRSSVPRHWRTRKDPFAAVKDQIYEQLELNPNLEVKALFNALQRRYPGMFKDVNLRTLQRRVREWRLSRTQFCEGVLLPETLSIYNEQTKDGAYAPTNY